MPPKNKGIKMSLDTFFQLGDSTGGSWADDDVDFNTIEIPIGGRFNNTGFSGQANPKDPAFGGNDSGSRGFRSERADRIEYPVPDVAPFRVRINNLPWEATEADIKDWFTNFLKDDTSVIKVVAPRDHADNTKLRGFAFVTFNTRDQLVQSLTLSGTDLLNRRVYVGVAQPEKESYGSRNDSGSGVDLDWGSARGSGVLPPPKEEREPREYKEREPRERSERKPKREEVDIDWGSARGSGVLPPPREYKEREPREHREPREQREPREPKKEDPALDWGSARGSGVLPPPKEEREPREYKDREPRERSERKPKKEEVDIDWGSARGSGVLPPQKEVAKEYKEREPREKSERKPKKEESDFDWGSARSHASLPAKKFSPSKPTATTNNTTTTTNTTQELPWARGQSVPVRATPAKAKEAATSTKEASKPTVKKHVFAALATEDDDEEEEEEIKKEKENIKEKSKKEEITELEKAAAALTVDEDDSEGWETVGKK